MRFYVGGTVGAGKTTLIDFIAKDVKEFCSTHGFVGVYKEKVSDNPILPLYYDSPRDWAYTMQVDFLFDKYNAVRESNRYSHSIVERSFEELIVFINLHKKLGNMSGSEYEMYRHLHDKVVSLIQSREDVFIFLDVPLDIAVQRVKQRNRSYEISEDLLSYWKNLNSEYELVMPEIKSIYGDNFLRLDGSSFDILANQGDRDYLSKYVRSFLR